MYNPADNVKLKSLDIDVEQLNKSSPNKSWHDLETVKDNIEKLVFPTKIDDEYDRGKVHEYKSQINFF